MIVEWFLAALKAFLVWLLSLFPDVAVPSWVANADGWFTTLLGNAASMGAWVPWTLLLSVAGVVAVCLAAGFTIKLVRIVASFLTLGGGSAA